MRESIRGTTKQARPDQPGTQVQVRLQPDLLRAVDAFRARLGIPTRPEAIRAALRILRELGRLD